MLEMGGKALVFGDKDAPHGNAAIIRMLGKAGANPNLPNSERQSSVKLAYAKAAKHALIAIGAGSKK